MTGDTPVPDVLHAEATTGVSAEASARPPRASKPDANRVRLCVVTRQELDPAELIRFVCSPDDVIVPDLARRLPGRGVWVTATRGAVAEAVKRSLFAKSLKKPVKTGKELVDQVEKLLAVEARQALSLANKAGLVTTGFSKVEIALEKGQAEALITASDASADGAGKLARKFKAIRGAAQLDAPVIQDFSSAELNLAIGGSNVIHAALAGGGLGRRVISSCRRLRHYRMQPDANESAEVGDGPDMADKQARASPLSPDREPDA